MNFNCFFTCCSCRGRSKRKSWSYISATTYVHAFTVDYKCQFAFPRMTRKFCLNSSHCLLVSQSLNNMPSNRYYSGLKKFIFLISKPATLSLLYPDQLHFEVRNRLQLYNKVKWNCRAVQVVCVFLFVQTTTGQICFSNLEGETDSKMGN